MKKKHSDDDTHVKTFEESFDPQTPAFFEVDTYEFVVNYYFERGIFDKAMPVLDAALRQHPYSTGLILMEAHRLSFLGQYEAALESIGKAKSFNPTDCECAVAESMIHNRHSEFQKAIDAIDAVAFYNEMPDEAHISLGIAHKGLDNFEAAAEHLEKCMKDDLTDIMLAAELAECYEFLGREDQAKDLYLKIIDEDPYCENAWYDLGILYLKNQEDEKALEALEFASVINDHFCLAHLALGKFHLLKEDTPKALKAFAKILESDFADAHSLSSVGEELYQAEELKEASRYFKAATDKDERDHRSWHGLGRCLLEREKWFESIHFLKKSIELCPDEAYVWLDLALAESSVGNEMSSHAAFESASKIGPDISEIWVRWAKFTADQQSPALAVDILRQGLEFLPDCAELYFSLSACLILDGDYKEALTKLEHALVLDYEKHTIIFDFFPNLETQKSLFKLVERYRRT